MVGPGGGGFVQSILASRHKPHDLFVGGDVEGFFHSKDGGKTYAILNKGLRDYWFDAILEHPTDPNILYIGGKSGIYKSTDRGASWTWKRKGFPPIHGGQRSSPITALVMDPSSPNIIFASVGCYRGKGDCKKGTIYKTDNAGESWSKVNNNLVLPANANIRAMVIHPKKGNVLYVATDTGVYKSTDGGKNWERKNSALTNNTNVRDIALAASTPNVMLISLIAPTGTTFKGGVYRSEDAGDHWTPAMDGLSKKICLDDLRRCSQYSMLAIDPKNPDIMWAASRDYVSKGAVYKSTDRGKSWKIVFLRGEKRFDDGWKYGDSKSAYHLTLSPFNSDVVYFAGNGQLWQTRDGGETWTQRFTIDNEDGTYRTSGLELTCNNSVIVNPLNPKQVFYGFADAGVFESLDGGISMARRGCFHRRGGARAMAFDSVKNDLWASCGNHGDLIAKWDGTRWVKSSNGLPQANHTVLLLDASVTPRKLITNSRRGVYYSTDGGKSWKQSKSDRPGMEDVRDVVKHPKNDSIYWAVVGSSTRHTPGSIWQSMDGALTFAKLADLPGADVQDLEIAQTHPEILYVAIRKGRGYPGGIFKSTGGGKHWRVAFPHHFTFPRGVTVDPTDADIVYAAFTDHPYHDNAPGNGLWMSADGGQSWTDIGQALPSQRIRGVTVHPLDHTKVFVSVTCNGVAIGQPLLSLGKPRPVVSTTSPGSDPAYAASATITAPATASDR
jgi:photosystem II stability/assembly factor-like uncharacterized protein